MKIEKISDDTLKVTLNVEDMIKWNVSYDNMTPGNPNSNEMFWDIIHLASKETGVVFENCKLTIEAMQKDEDTFVIFITRKSLGSTNNLIESPKKYKYRRKQGKPTENSSVLVYTFENFNDLCKFAKNNLYFCLLFENNNCLYKHNNAFRLVVNIPPNLKEYVPQFNACISEYADQVDNSYLYSSYLLEHEKQVIPKNSLKVIYNNF